MSTKNHQTKVSPNFLGIVNRVYPEWLYMWDQLSKNELNIGFHDKKTCYNHGYTWGYMGTVNHFSENKHCFRHLLHPAVNTTIVLYIPVSKSFNLENLIPALIA